jgi:small-conductance mechanosensitive channel
MPAVRMGLPPLPYVKRCVVVDRNLGSRFPVDNWREPLSAPLRTLHGCDSSRRPTLRPRIVKPLLALVAAFLATTPLPGAPAHEPLIDYLNASIAWFRELTQARLGSRPADATFFDEDRAKAAEVLSLSFEFAKADAALLSEETGVNPQPSSGPSPGMLARMASDAAARVRVQQQELERLQQALSASSQGRRATLERQIAEARSELALAQARQETARTVSDFVSQTSGGGASGGNLAATIAQLERSTPEVHGRDARSTAAPQPAQPAQAVGRPPPSGVLALVSDLLSLSRNRRELSRALDSTVSLRATADKLRAPLIEELRATLQQGDQLSAAPETSNAAVLRQRTRSVDEITARFKKLSAAAIPLEKQTLLLDGLRTSLGEWRDSLERQYDSELKSLLLHLFVLVVAISLILAASDFWRRATFRYVQDVHRRQQFLLLRRIAVTLAVSLFVVFALVTEVGSLATFAGFITAGLAVALQNVILSIAAYFFLIGKYGVRVGDRVQVSGVNGDVIDVGLVRLHLMELSADGHPTGRVVVFSNAVLFQPNANFFKQIPGSSFSWHQVALGLSPGSDYRLAEARVMKSVEKVYSGYRDAIDQQHQRISQDLSVPMSALKPQSQLHLAGAGIEMVIRYPVPLDRASEIDDQITRGVLEAIEREPGLTLLGGGRPLLQVNQAPAGGHA